MNMQYEHDNPPKPFNPLYRKGFGEALTKAHGIWCKAHPDVTRQERMQAYKKTADTLKGKYPSIKEQIHKG